MNTETETATLQWDTVGHQRENHCRDGGMMLADQNQPEPGEGQQKKNSSPCTWPGVNSERWHKTAPAGERLWRPYASHGVKRTDDDDFEVHSIYMSNLSLNEVVWGPHWKLYTVMAHMLRALTINQMGKMRTRTCKLHSTDWEEEVST